MKTYNKALKIGIQFEGIAEKIQWTLLDKHRQGGKDFDRINNINQLINRFGGNIQRIGQNLTTSNNDIVIMVMDKNNACLDHVFFNLSRLDNCPVCGNGRLKAKVWYNPARGSISRGYQLRQSFSRFDNFTCTHCQTQFDLSLSKEDHINKNVHILFTTVESLEILMMDPRFITWFSNKLAFLVLDEMHVYHSLYGIHVANILRRLRKISCKTRFIGSSATIDNPYEFGSKLFGSNNLKVIEPSKRDMKDLDSYEYYYFIRSGLNAATLSTYIQLAMLLGHSVIPRGERMITFFDSRDLVYRSTKQISDAENSRLWEFRVNRNQILFGGNICNGYYPGCHINCQIYNAGECWLVYPKLAGLQHLPITQPLKEGMDLDSVTAQDRNYNSNARIIHATSVLELGIDDPKVTFIGQYRAPHTVYSFIQRKGRGGRNLKDDLRVFVVLGNDVSDLFYFKRADNIVSQPYSLPLEPDNPNVKQLHDILQDITDEITSRAVSSGRLDPWYVNIITWEVLLDKVLCDQFKIFLNKVFFGGQGTLSAIQVVKMKNTLKNVIDKEIQKRKKEIQRIISKYGVSISPAQIIQELLDELEDLKNRYPQYRRDISCLINDLQRLTDAVILGDSHKESKVIDDIRQTFIRLLNQIFGQSGVDELSSVLSRLFQTVQIIRNQGSLAQDMKDIERLWYEIESLLQLNQKTARGYDEGALNYSIPNRIVKYLLRSWYFYCKACRIVNNGKCQMLGQTGIDDQYISSVRFPMDICSPIAYFDDPINIILNIDNTYSRTISDIDALFNYIPYKTVIESIGGNIRVVCVKPTILDIDVLPGGALRVEIAPSYASGRERPYGNRVALTPEIIQAELLDLDTQGECLVAFCEHCLNYYNHFMKYCPKDGNRLTMARLYVEPLVERTFNISNELKITNHLSLANVIGYHVLSELNVEVLKYRWENNRWTPAKRGIANPLRINARYSVPLAFEIRTRGVLFRVSKDLMDKVLDKETRKYLQHKNSTPEEVFYHTLAHLLLLTVASVSGVNPDQFWYFWDQEKGLVAIWERYEGGSGICETFRDILLKDPARVYEEMKRIVDCPIHKAEKELANRYPANLTNPFKQGTIEYSEYQNLLNSNLRLKMDVWRELKRIIQNSRNLDSYNSRIIIEQIASRLNISEDDVLDNLPTCIDGCPFCLGVPYCRSGRDRQYTNISLRVARRIFENLKYETYSLDDATNAVLRGGRIVEYDERKFTIFLL